MIITNFTENIFLSKLDAMVQLRPQFNHLDALGDLEKPAMNYRSKGAAEIPNDEPQARAVNMTVKSTEGEETDLYGDMGETAKLLKAMREESWQRLTWIDSEVRTLRSKAHKRVLKSYRTSILIGYSMMRCSFMIQRALRLWCRP